MVNQNNEFLPLFQPSDSDPVNNARIFTGYYRRNFQILGYKIAADNLVQQVLKNGQDQDILVYPIVYLYRHYLEILFKMIIENGCEYFRIQKNPNTIHGLKSLWNSIKEIIHKISNEEGISQENEYSEKEIEYYIEEFDKVDPTSQAFRYHIDLRGNEFIKEIEIINIKHFYECINKISNYLEGISDYLEAGLDE